MRVSTLWSGVFLYILPWTTDLLDTLFRQECRWHAGPRFSNSKTWAISSWLGNVNPIEKVEKSTLIVASKLHSTAIVRKREKEKLMSSENERKLVGPADLSKRGGRWTTRQHLKNFSWLTWNPFRPTCLPRNQRGNFNVFFPRVSVESMFTYVK